MLKTLLRRTGVDLVRYPSRVHSPLGCFLNTQHVEAVIDVGANVGQYGHQIRTLEGFRGAIVSFEPDPVSFDRLKERIGRDPKWTAYEMALGESTATAGLHRSKFSVFNSFHDATPYGLEADECIRTVTTEMVPVRSLDELSKPPSARTLLKIDTQGHEVPILRGARTYLTGNVVGLQLEMSFRALYEEQPLFCEALTFVQSLGFHPWAFTPVFADPTTGALVEVDALFLRSPC